MTRRTKARADHEKGANGPPVLRGQGCCRSVDAVLLMRRRRRAREKSRQDACVSPFERGRSGRGLPLPYTLPAPPTDSNGVSNHRTQFMAIRGQVLCRWLLGAVAQVLDGHLLGLARSDQGQLSIRGTPARWSKALIDVAGIESATPCLQRLLARKINKLAMVSTNLLM